MAPLMTSLCFGGTQWLRPNTRADSVTSLNGDSRPGDSDTDEDDAVENFYIAKARGQAPDDSTPVSAAKFKSTPDIDSKIKQLKEQGYADKYVATKLQGEGHPHLTDKTVATRWRRIRADLEKREEERLDDELTDWHEGEDEKLEEAFNVAEQKFQKGVEKLAEQKWKNVSFTLASMLNRKKYTAKACKERYHGIQDGTALQPIERDPDQEGRRLLREQRIEDNKRRRKAAAEAAVHTASERKRRAEEGKEWKVKHQLKQAEHRHARRIEKEEDRRLRLERKLGKEAERAAREAGQRLLKAELEEKKRVKEDEDRVYKFLTGRELVRKHIKRTVADGDSESEAEMTNEGVMYLDESDEDTASSEDDALPIISKPKGKKRYTSGTPAKVTPETLVNPRSVMSMLELEILLFERDLPRRGLVESHPEIVARIAADDKLLTSVAINALLEKHFAPQNGNLAERIVRLQKADADNSVAGKQGVQSTDLEFKYGYEGYESGYEYLLEEE